MKKIIVSITNDITIDQRVAKVCETLFNAGFEVVLVGRQLQNSLPINRKYKTKRFKLFFNSSFLFYMEYNMRLFFFLLFTKKDMLLANDLDTLLPNYLVSKMQRKKLIFDSHELFSEIPELVTKPFVKKCWLQLENLLIPKLRSNYTVCQSIADYYKDNYNVIFEVIRNLPVYKNNTIVPLSTLNDKKIILYQGAVNVGRGIELMIDTMCFLSNYVFVIVGTGDVINNLKKIVEAKKLTEKVIFLGKKEPEELHAITPNAYIGISLEEDLGLNYRYALPNKIFDYIQAEVPVLVADLPEMSKLIKEYRVGEVAVKRTPKDLATQIKQMNKSAYSKALKEAKKELVWETQEKKLLSIFQDIV